MLAVDNQLNTSEMKMFDEVFSILKKYKGQTREFGLQLVHSHFNIQRDEILHETHDESKRVLYITPVNISDVINSKATAWKFLEDGTVKVAMFCCDGPS